MERTTEAGRTADETGYQADDLTIDLGRQRVTRGETVIPLAQLSFDFLVALARAAPNLLTFDQLIERVWPGLVVSPETIIQRAKVVRDALGDDARSPRYIAGVRGRGYRMLVAVTPLAAAAAGSAEAQEREVHPTLSRFGVKPWWWAMGGMGLGLMLVLLSAYLLLGRTHPGPVTAKGEPVSIAVLPFTDLSPAKDNEYFSDGMSEELLNRLAKTQGLRVTGRTSSFAFKGKNEDLRDIGERLGVKTILEGSVRKEEDRVRVTAELVNAQDGSALWSDSYDRHLQGVFEIQDEIASRVVTALKRTLLVEGDATAGADASAPRRPTSNVEAYNSYLRGQYLLRKRIGKEMEQALVEFQHAVTLDPKFAPAYVGVSNSLMLLEAYGYRNTADVAPRAQQAIARALELDPDLGDAYAAKYFLLAQLETAPSKRLPVLERAVALNPNDTTALAWLGGQISEGLTERLRVLERAYAIDPLAPVVISSFIWALQEAGYKERALALVDEGGRLMPESNFSQRERAWFAIADGRIDESIRWYSRAFEIAPDDWDGWRFEQSYEFLGDTAAAARLYERAVRQRPADTEIAGAQIRMLTWSGDTERAMALLRDRLQRYPDDPYLHRAQAFYLYQTEPRQALASLRAAAPLLFSDPPELEYPVCYLDAPTAVFLSRQSDETARASTIAAAVYAFADEVGRGEQFWANWMRVRTAAALGDRIGVAKYLDELYRMGSALPAPALHEPLFKPYLNDPQIAPRLVKHAERRAEWRRQLAAEGL